MSSGYPEFDGRRTIEVMVEQYNKGVSLAQLKKWAESKTYIKSLKFTGKENILNEILNADQYFKLQIHWAFAAVYAVKHLTKTSHLYQNHTGAGGRIKIERNHRPCVKDR